MLTIFTSPKSFQGTSGVIQTNAITSWTLLEPRPDIMLFGDAPGAAEISSRLGLRHVSQIATNAQGTPLISDLFAQAEAMSSNPVMCFVNADIILTDEAVRAIGNVAKWSPRFLIVGRRVDVEIADFIDFSSPDWAREIRQLASDRGQRRSALHIDWFVYPRNTWPRIPPFAIGRLYYDNWLLWSAAESGVPIIDATRFVSLIHQRHDYSHLRSGGALWSSPETRQNRELIQHWSHYHSIAHAGWMLTSSGEVVPSKGWQYRLSRPRRTVSHLLSFTRPLRRRLRRRTYGVEV